MTTSITFVTGVGEDGFGRAGSPHQDQVNANYIMVMTGILWIIALDINMARIKVLQRKSGHHDL